MIHDEEGSASCRGFPAVTHMVWKQKVPKENAPMETNLCVINLYKASE